MPRELIAVAPCTPELREYVEPDLNPTLVRIRSELASPKHGTELVAYRNDPVSNRPYDPAWGAVLPASPGAAQNRFPMRLGNMTVGTVVETGAAVTRFAVGDRVFGHLPIRETHTVEEGKVDLLPGGLAPEAAVCLDPVVMALPVRDAGIRLGDTVAVFGLGAIGLVAVQLARLAGAATVIAVDPIEKRRALALAFGADIVIDPNEHDGDAALAIRALGGVPAPVPQPRSGTHVTGGYVDRPTQVNQLGVDVAIETSGSTQALHQAIRATRFGGTVCVVSFYGREGAGLLLGEEFHINQLTMRSVRAESLPMRDAPAWTLQRVVDLALDWMEAGKVRTDGLLDPIVPFADAVAAYRDIDEHPERSIKLGIRFG